MAMGDNVVRDCGDHAGKIEVGAGGTNSAWKISTAASSTVVADSESWPAFSHVQQQSKCNGTVDSDAGKLSSQMMQTQTETAPSVMVEQQKFHGCGSFKSPHRMYTTNQNKASPKHGQNSRPPFAVPLPYYPSPMTPVFHTMAVVPPTSALRCAYPLTPRPFPRADSMNAMAPRPFMRPPFLGRIGFVDGPSHQGPPRSVYYYPAAPQGSVRVPYPLSPGVPKPSLLRNSIVKQIEYYFSDENLQDDHYLISLMDHQGWVPISVIAGFNRVKRMNAGIPFILDALQASRAIEVQGEKVRRRNEWSKWIPSSLRSETAPPIVNAMDNDNHNKNKGESAEGTIELPTPNGCNLDHLALTADITKNSLNDDREQKDCSEALGMTPRNSCNNDSKLPTMNVNNLDDKPSDFSSAFTFDEEQKILKNDHPSPGRNGHTVRMTIL